MGPAPALWAGCGGGDAPPNLPHTRHNVPVPLTPRPRMGAPVEPASHPRGASASSRQAQGCRLRWPCRDAQLFTSMGQIWSEPGGCPPSPIGGHTAPTPPPNHTDQRPLSRRLCAPSLAGGAQSPASGGTWCGSGPAPSPLKGPLPTWQLGLGSAGQRAWAGGTALSPQSRRREGAGTLAWRQSFHGHKPGVLRTWGPWGLGVEQEPRQLHPHGQAWGPSPSTKGRSRGSADRGTSRTRDL